jgi:predicted amidohydrolase YtcJ
MKTTRLIKALGAFSLVSGPVFSQTADTLYHGGSILTMAGNEAAYVEALAVKDGKLADIVILDKDPLKVEPMAIKDIKVLETIKEWKSVYSAK